MLKPFFTYFGGKYRVALKYPKPIYDIIIEPFAGSAGYSLRYPERQIHLYDKDEKICGVWDYLIKSSKDEILNLPLDMQNGVDHYANLCQEAKWLIGFWLNKGTTSPCKMPSSWMRQGSHTNSFWGQVIRNRIAEQVDQIKHWKITHKSYNEIENKLATWYIDPPYQKAGVHYRESAKNINFSNLSKFCLERSGQVIVCENYGANWLPFEMFSDIKSTPGSKRSGISKEFIYHRGGEMKIEDFI
jgi:site-specific DNA-adenine methylase